MFFANALDGSHATGFAKVWKQVVLLHVQVCVEGQEEAPYRVAKSGPHGLLR
jgi:hypothetical protein